MGVRAESMLCPVLGDDLFLMPKRSRQQITERLDRLISEIKKIQQPYMHGEEDADVILVCSRAHCSIYFDPLALPTAANRCTLQVAHGLILRCFTKRWIGLSIDNRLPIMFEPGAISVLRYVHDTDL
jgi:hypothetical protein